MLGIPRIVVFTLAGREAANNNACVHLLKRLDNPALHVKSGQINALSLQPNRQRSIRSVTGPDARTKDAVHVFGDHRHGLFGFAVFICCCVQQ